MRREFTLGSFIIILIISVISYFWKEVLWSFVVFGPLIIVGFIDMLQRKHTIRRNFPIIGNFRYFFESIRPEINQYFVESNFDGVPVTREMRSVVYQRAKNVLDTLPFGTKRNVYEVGYEWVNHSLDSKHVDTGSLRLPIGGSDCSKPYSASYLNISAMSYGALSKNAVLALNKGARMGNFAHNTGEGGLSKYHLEHGGDLIWQIGTGYFGARTLDGKFNPELFQENAGHKSVKMIEIKLSQGAKPGHGGILPAVKVDKEISETRNVPVGKDVISPPAHSEFNSPEEMMDFIAKLRELSGGKPIGIKMCVGKRREFLAICKAMVKTGIKPDYIAVDGGEGGTGAAPLEFSNSIGSPLDEALIFVHNSLVGFSLRDEIKIICSSKIFTGFHIVKNICIGADLCYSARGMMLALGCIQALRCNSNNCPTGVTTQDPNLVAGLVVNDKAVRVANYHEQTIKSVAEIIGAMGLESPKGLRPWHRMRRTDFTEIKHYGEIYEFIKKGDLLNEPYPVSFDRAMKACNAETFQYTGDEK